VQARQQRILYAFRRVVTFVDERPRLTNAANNEAAALTAQVNALKGVISRADASEVAQLTLTAAATRAATDEPTLRKTLIDHHLRSVVNVARGIRGTVPGIGTLTMPNTNARSARLIAEATAFAHQAEVYASVLIEHGLPSEFVQQLHAAIQSLRASIDARGGARSNLRGATHNVGREIALGRRIVSVLDGVVPRLLRDQPDEVAVWRAAKRIKGRVSPVHAIAENILPAPTQVQPASTPLQDLAVSDGMAAD
jgi:hypothetical protein